MIIKSDHHISKAIYLNQSSCILNKFFKKKNIKTKLNNTKNINQKKKKKASISLDIYQVTKSTSIYVTSKQKVEVSKKLSFEIKGNKCNKNKMKL